MGHAHRHSPRSRSCDQVAVHSILIWIQQRTHYCIPCHERFIAQKARRYNAGNTHQGTPEQGSREHKKTTAKPIKRQSRD